MGDSIAETDGEQALARSVSLLMAPLARLAIARGMKFPQALELLKQAFVVAARSPQPRPGQRDVSRVATMTGVTRREVTRLTSMQRASRAERASPATQLFTRWAADRRLRDSRGRHRSIPRSGRAPSFESMARAITRDVHPSRLLEELIRLGLVTHNVRADTVRLARDAFVPDHDDARLLAFLARNVGDHLSAGVANVLGEPRRHFEQALFADDLTLASADAAKKLVQAQWRALTAALVPELDELLAADRKARRGGANPTPRIRLRIGLYSYDEAMSPASSQESDDE